MPTLDLVVCGSVAVNADGARVGKGAGYSDLELALLTEAGLVDFVGPLDAIADQLVSATRQGALA